MGKFWFAAYFIFVFLTGWFFHAIYMDNFVTLMSIIPDNYKQLEDNKANGKEEPAGTDSIFENFLKNERYSPKDRISEQQIHVYDDKIVIDAKNPSWSSFVDTNSMDPLIDKGANGIELKPSSPYDIKVGDVISYEYKGSIIIHRVVKIEKDDKGIYFITKGDNNIAKDPAKVRFEQVRGVLVGVLY